MSVSWFPPPYTRGEIGRAARRVRHHERHRFRRIPLRICNLHQRGQRQSREHRKLRQLNTKAFRKVVLFSVPSPLIGSAVARRAAYFFTIIPRSLISDL